MATRVAILGPVSAQIAFVIELTLVPVLLPSIQADLELSLLEIALIFNAYSIAMAVGIVACATGGDRFKSLKIFGLGVALFLAGSVFIYAATDNSALIMGRVCQGLGAGMFSPLIPVLLTQAAPNRPGRTLILWGSTAGYIAAFAPLAYGTVLTEANWNLAFLFIALVAGLSLVLVAMPQATGMVTSSENAATNYSAIFRSKELWLTFAYVFATYGAITYFLFRVPLWLTEIGKNTASIGVVLSVLWLSFSILSALLRNMVDNHHLRLIMVSAPILIALGLIFALSTNILLLILSACLVGCGLACSNAPSTQMVLRFAPKGLSALATCIDISAARLGGIVMVTALAEIGLSTSVGVISVSSLLAAACAHIVADPNVKPR
ncbi:MFS transporter [Tateyamaria sp. SN3-11]|uniref:MFS transporter n=1 Tax=Tateyamaria sp. SN3-11 TaxID=3092147 RepID=UPI0039E99B33